MIAEPTNIDSMTPAEAYRQGREDLATELLLQKVKLQTDQDAEATARRDRRIAELEAKVVVLEKDAGDTAMIQADLARRMIAVEREIR